MSHVLVADEAWIARRPSDGSGGGKKIACVGCGSRVFDRGFIMGNLAESVDGEHVL